MAKHHDSSYRSDGYGLQPTAWRLTPDPDDPPRYAEARALGREQAEAIFAKAEEERQFKAEVEGLSESLAEAGGTAGLPDWLIHLPVNRPGWPG